MTLGLRRTRITNWSTQLGTSLRCHPAANIDLARAAVLARRRARLLLNGLTRGVRCSHHHRRVGSDYDSDDNSTAAQVHRFFAKVEGLGIGDNVLYADPWA